MYACEEPPGTMPTKLPEKPCGQNSVRERGPRLSQRVCSAAGNIRLKTFAGCALVPAPATLRYWTPTMWTTHLHKTRHKENKNNVTAKRDTAKHVALVWASPARRQLVSQRDTVDYRKFHCNLATTTLSRVVGHGFPPIPLDGGCFPSSWHGVNGLLTMS